MAIAESKLKIYDRILGTLSATALIIGGLWTLINYIDTRKSEIKQRDQAVRQAIYNQKKEMYFELCDAAADVAACNTAEEVLTAQKHFRRLYCGKIHIIAQLDDSVIHQKIAFNSLLQKYNDSSRP